MNSRHTIILIEHISGIQFVVASNVTTDQLCTQEYYRMIPALPDSHIMSYDLQVSGTVNGCKLFLFLDLFGPCVDTDVVVWHPIGTRENDRSLALVDLRSMTIDDFTTLLRICQSYNFVINPKQTRQLSRLRTICDHFFDGDYVTNVTREMYDGLISLSIFQGPSKQLLALIKIAHGYVDCKEVFFSHKNNIGNMFDLYSLCSYSFKTDNITHLDMFGHQYGDFQRPMFGRNDVIYDIYRFDSVKRCLVLSGDRDSISGIYQCKNLSFRLERAINCWRLTRLSEPVKTHYFDLVDHIIESNDKYGNCAKERTLYRYFYCCKDNYFCVIDLLDPALTIKRIAQHYSYIPSYL